MNIRFKVDQTDSFRRGIDAPTPIATLTVNPKELAKEQRELIAKHLLPGDDPLSVDVVYDPDRARQYEAVPVGGPVWGDLIEAKDPSLDSLLVALLKIESQ